MKPDPFPWDDALVADIIERVFEGLKEKGVIK